MPSEQTRPLSGVSFYSTGSFEETPGQLGTITNTDSAPMNMLSSSESLDSYSYDTVNAMEILNLAEALDAAAETVQEQTSILYDSEEFDIEELLGSEETFTTSVLAESMETVTMLIPVGSEETVPALTQTEDVYDVSENQHNTLAQSSTSELEYHSAFERAPSRTSASSSVSRIPRVCQSLVLPLIILLTLGRFHYLECRIQRTTV